MPSLPTQEDRHRRLIELAGHWGISLPHTPTPLTRPNRPPSFRTADDDFYAEELVKRRQISHGRTESTGNLRKAFSSSKKKAYDPRVVFDALNSHVANCGRPGVAESLIDLLVASGGDVNLPQKPKTGLLSRRRSLESFGERSRLLQQAVHNRQSDMVAVLIPHADTVALDASFPLAMRNQDIPVVELLLRYGAGAASTPDGQDCFRQACAFGGQFELVSLVLRSEGRPSMQWNSQCLIDAARAGCFETVWHLSRSSSDGNFNQAEGLKVAIAQGRHDIALAIVMGSKPPQGQGLNEAFIQLMEHPSMNPNDRAAVAELLLCIGAEGDGPAIALLNSAAAEFLNMVQVLVKYGASIEYRDAMALRKAITNGKVDVAHILLSGNSPLSSLQASECVELLPKTMALEHRRLFLELLLRRGASGTPLNDALIEAAEAGDADSAIMLLTPHFPGGHAVDSPGRARRGSKSMVFERHEVASVDYKGGLALQIAVRRGDVVLTRHMLATKPSGEMQAQVFSQTKTLAPQDRYRMVECFLEHGLAGPALQGGLQEAIDERPPHRDENLIALFLKYTNDIRSSEGPLAAAVNQQDIKLLAALLKKRVSPQTAAEMLPMVVATPDPRARLEMTSLILSSVSNTDPVRVSSAMVQVLNSQPPVDLRLLQVLLQQGRADINADDGIAVATSIRSHDPPVLDMMLKYGSPSPATLSRGLSELSHLPPSEKKAAKFQALLRRSKDPAACNDILLKEVCSLLKVEPQQRFLSMLSALLASGADAGSHNAAALCHAVAAKDAQITDMLLATKPSPTSLAYALPHALRIAEPQDRLTFANKLLDAGAPGAEANRALGFAIKTYSDDMPLLRSLSGKANTTDGEALVAAVKRERPDIVDLVLQRGHSQSLLNSAFAEATKCQSKENRAIICTQLLRHGASGSVASDALQAAAADGDLVLGSILVKHGVGVDDKAIVEACRSGSADVLSMLLSGKESPNKTTLEKGFQAATEVGDLKRRASILVPLLARGVGGDALNAQLVSAVRFGGDGENLVKILLKSGADPNYQGGEAIWTAIQSAYMGSLKMMLGIAEGRTLTKQHKPTGPTLTRALDAAWKLSGSRLSVLNLLFEAGLPIGEELHKVLNKAVNEEVPDENVIETLIAHGASPLANNGETLIHTAQRCLPSVARIILEADLPAEQLSSAVQQSFTQDNTDVWFTDKGFLVLQSFLDRGTRGQGLSAVLALVLDHSSKNQELSDRFVNLLFEHDVDVDYQDGTLLESATSARNLVLVKRLLEKKPKAETLSRAFHRVFDRPLPEEQALDLMKLFTEYADGETRLDVMYSHPGSPPVLFLAIATYPRSTKILKTLLDAGYYHDQTTTCVVMPEVEEEESVTLLSWCLLQPQKKVSSSLIELLIQAGAKVNIETRHSRMTPLMLAVQARRPDVVKMLLLEGAEVDVADAKGNTPLTLATDMGGELAITMMSNLLAAGASRNDGSLHNAARELNLPAVQVLVEYGHDPDFPSYLHDGRSALGELCLHGADGGGELTAVREKLMEKVMDFLIEKGSDITLKTGGKTILHLALESQDPMVTTRLLLRVGMWKHVNQKFGLYTDGQHTFSPTMYVRKVLPESDLKDQLFGLLKANRAEDVFYSNSGPQPDDAIGLPDDIALQERERRARLSRLANEQEDHKLSVARSKELAAMQAQIWANQAEMEDTRRRRTQNEEIAAVGDRARAEEEAFNAAMRRRHNERATEVAHERTLAEAAGARARQAMELEARKQAKALEWERKVATERVDHAKAMSALRIAEREDVERMDRQQDERVNRRIAEQKRLVDSQTGLAGQLAGAGVNGRRQIGYITGELN